MSFIKSLLESSSFDANRLIEAELNARALHVVSEMTKDADFVYNTRIMEMRDAPDNSKYPLTRRAVEKLLTKYERREDDSTGFDNPEPRTIEGAKRVRWYAPEHNSDFASELTDNPGNDRPAKLMPYDYEFSVHRPNDINTEPADEIGDTDTEVEDGDDWEGETNKFFKESVESTFLAESDEDARENVVKLLHDSTKHSYPVEFHLDDGSYVTVHPHDAQHFINSGKAGDVLDHITSASHFQAFLKDVYNHDEGVGHDTSGE